MITFVQFCVLLLGVGTLLLAIDALAFFVSSKPYEQLDKEEDTH